MVLSEGSGKAHSSCSQRCRVLRVSDDIDGLVRLLEVLHLLFAELHVETTCRRASYLVSHRSKGKESELTEDILEIGHTRGPDDWGGHSGLRHDPR